MNANMSKLCNLLDTPSSASRMNKRPSSSNVPPPKRDADSKGKSPAVSVSCIYESIHECRLFYLQVNIDYPGGSRTYPITPSRKPGVKAYARNFRKSVALECVKDLSSREYAIQHFYSVVDKELKYLCSDHLNSILRSRDIEHFTWEKLLDELRKNAPTFFGFLETCFRTRTPRQNSDAVMGFCSAIILKHRYDRMNLVQKILSLVMYSGHAGKQVVMRMNVNMCFNMWS